MNDNAPNSTPTEPEARPQRAPRTFGGPVIHATGGVPVESRDVNRMEGRQARSAEVHDATGGAAVCAPANDQRSVEQKTRDTVDALNRKPRTRELLYDLLDWCHDEHTMDDAERFVTEHPAYRSSDPSPHTVVGYLLRSGGLEQIDYDAEGAVVTEERRRAAVEEARRAAAGRAAGEPAADETPADEQDPADAAPLSPAEPAGFSPAGPNAACPAPADALPEVDEQEVLDELVDHSGVIISEAGQNALDELDPAARVHALAEGAPERVPVFRALLETLEQGPCHFEKLNAALRPLLAQLPPAADGQRLQTGYFVDALSAADGIRWTAAAGWSATPAGAQLLEELREADAGNEA